MVWEGEHSSWLCNFCQEKGSSVAASGRWPRSGNGFAKLTSWALWRSQSWLPQLRRFQAGAKDARRLEQRRRQVKRMHLVIWVPSADQQFLQQKFSTILRITIFPLILFMPSQCKRPWPRRPFRRPGHCWKIPKAKRSQNGSPSVGQTARERKTTCSWNAKALVTPWLRMCCLRTIEIRIVLYQQPPTGAVWWFLYI